MGVECKRVDAPGLTASVRKALNDLDLYHLIVIYPGARAYFLPLSQLPQGAHALITAGGGRPGIRRLAHPLASSTLMNSSIDSPASRIMARSVPRAIVPG